MFVLVGCEESGVVRRAFADNGHDAWSCDLLPARDGSIKHFKMDIMSLLANQNIKWDIIILHPPCTALSLSGNSHYASGKPRHASRLDALDWTKSLWELAKISALVGCALENPVGVLWGTLGKPQFIQPWQFGHGECKNTGILTHGLPPLVPTDIVEGRAQRIANMPDSKGRAQRRSETYGGIAKAMADQWG